LSPADSRTAVRDPKAPSTPLNRQFGAISAPLRRSIYSVSALYTHLEIHMKTLNGIAALSLSLILGLVPFALIAVDDFVVAKAEVSTTVAADSVHALGMEGR
jgi:hypothetical protein